MTLSHEQRAHDIAIAVLRFKQDQLLETTKTLASRYQLEEAIEIPDVDIKVYLDAYEKALKNINDNIG